ncbi:MULTISPECIES: HNH endonuclease [Spirulina]|uniref:HNH endonuclease n=1 Tax=Spirulina TaxID=1154 RepID=UPI00232B87FA|nr:MULTISPECIES: HNH endonuclease [Spirulina]
MRDAAFRRVVVSIYEQRCALCRLQVIAPNGQGIVDGAHIRPFSEFHDDRIVNGLSLCKNHHWAFDRGWFSIDPDGYRVVVASGLREDSPNGAGLMSFHGGAIVLPNLPHFNPSPISLEWHSKNTFI